MSDTTKPTVTTLDSNLRAKLVEFKRADADAKIRAGCWAALAAPP
jgi:hypothetical protein